MRSGELGVDDVHRAENAKRLLPVGILRAEFSAQRLDRVVGGFSGALELGHTRAQRLQVAAIRADGGSVGELAVRGDEMQRPERIQRVETLEPGARARLRRGKGR